MLVRAIATIFMLFVLIVVVILQCGAAYKKGFITACSQAGGNVVQPVAPVYIVCIKGSRP